MTAVFPIDFNQKRVALVQEVQRATGLTVIMAEPETPNAPRPPKPYITMKMVTPAGKYGDDSAEQFLDDLGQPTTIWNRGGQRKMVVDFNCYGCSHEQAYNYMALLQSWLELETTQARLYAAAQIAVWLNGSVTDLSALLTTGFEGRALLEVAFGISANLTEDLSAVTTVDITGELDINTGTEAVAVTVVAP